LQPGKHRQWLDVPASWQPIHASPFTAIVIKDLDLTAEAQDMRNAIPILKGAHYMQRLE
jgi:hypothetical protein